MKTHLKVCLNIAGLLVISQSVFATDKIPPAEVVFFGSGFTVQTPAGASQLELRMVETLRQMIFNQSTTGGDIHWSLSDTKGNGEYRHEAVVVMEINGQSKQRNSGGGFEVQGGLLIGPLDAADLEARIRGLDEQTKVPVNDDEPLPVTDYHNGSNGHDY